MSQNTYSKPKLIIAGKRIPEFENISFSERSGGEINQLSVSIKDPDYQDAHLFNAKVEFFLNEGLAEATPTFVGYVREMRPSDTQISITAYDPRVFLAGKEAMPVVITDQNNYDGYSAVQFLSDIIKNKLNVTDTIIDISALSDTNPPVPMKGYRTEGSAPYDVFLDLIENVVDDTTPKDPLEIFVAMEGDKIIVGNKRSLDSDRTLSLSFMDGIKSMSYNFQIPRTRAIVTGPGGSWGEFTYGNSPMGIVGTTFRSDKENNAELSDVARIEVMKNYVESKEISLSVTRGFDVGLENIVYVNVPDKTLRGNHRVTSKDINVSRSGVNCTLGLDKRIPRVGDYLERKIKLI